MSFVFRWIKINNICFSITKLLEDCNLLFKAGFEGWTEVKSGVCLNFTPTIITGGARKKDTLLA